MELELNLQPLALPGIENKRPLVIAGPCSAETEEQVMDTARQLANNGIRIFRAGVWKPRTKPGGFEGKGVEALPWMQRVKAETGMLLATEVAPALASESASDEAGLVKRMISALNAASEEMQTSMRGASDALTRVAAQNRAAMEQFDQTVGRFNAGVHDFGEVDYNLRGSVERMDLAIRDLANAMREVKNRMEGERG